MIGARLCAALLAAVVAGMGMVESGRAQSYPRAAGEDHRADRCGWHGRCHHSPDCERAFVAAGRELLRRQPQRRRQHARLARGGARRTGRLYAADEQRERPGDQPTGLPKRGLRPDQELRADRPGGGGLAHSRGQSVASVQVGGGAGGLCQGQSGQAQLWLGRHRHAAASGRRAVQVHCGHRSGACSLSRRRAVDRRRDCGQRAIDVRGIEPAAAAYPRRAGCARSR